VEVAEGISQAVVDGQQVPELVRQELFLSVNTPRGSCR
jgi:hypothetical protein